MKLKKISMDLKNVKFESAGCDKLERYSVDLINGFIKKIFGITDFMLTDESMLSDFTMFYSDKQREKIYKKILKIYKVDIYKIKGHLYFWKIFKEIEKE